MQFFQDFQPLKCMIQETASEYPPQSDVSIHWKQYMDNNSLALLNTSDFFFGGRIAQGFLPSPPYCVTPPPPGQQYRAIPPLSVTQCIYLWGGKKIVNRHGHHKRHGSHTETCT